MKKSAIFCLLVILLAFDFIGCDNGTTTYTVTFDLDGGNINGDISSVIRTVKAGETILNLPNPQKENYNFGGWYTKKMVLAMN